MLSRRRSRGFYDPLSEMNRLVNQVFVGGLPRQAGTEQGTPGAGWAPSIDVVQRDDDLVIRAELPGARPEDVDITVQNGVLTISGKLEEEREEERQGYLVTERRYGTFRRSLQLPQDVAEDRIHARFENGSWRSLSRVRRRPWSPGASRSKAPMARTESGAPKALAVLGGNRRGSGRKMRGC